MYYKKSILDKIPTVYLLASFEASKYNMRTELRAFELTDQEIVNAVLRPNFDVWSKEKCNQSYQMAKENVFKIQELRKNGELSGAQFDELISITDKHENEIKKYNMLKKFESVWEGYFTSLCQKYLGQFILSDGKDESRINVADEYMLYIDSEKIRVVDFWGRVREICYSEEAEFYDCLFGKAQKSENSQDSDLKQ